MQTLREKIEADVRQQADKQACEKYEILLTQERLKIQRLEKAAQEMQKKAQPTSQELQGEVQEIAIEAYLRKNFPLDSIEEVKKGHRGPDCMQVVNDYKLQGCGVICYESKRTKDFKKEWIEKLKEDMQERGAQVGVLVTQVLPKSMEHMGNYEGVWVCTFQEFKGLCGVLRERIIALAWAQKSQEDKGDKISTLYNYLVGPEFAKEVEEAITTYREMKRDLDKEKQAMEKIWAKRTKQIEKIAAIVVRTRGSIEGIAGSAIAPIKILELGAGEDGIEE